jgi:uncharacterized protein (TIGR03083 family)
METTAMLARLAADGAALRAAAADLDAAVPTCPGWAVRDAVLHTGMVYAHKATVIEGGLDQPPQWWPPDFGDPAPVEFYDEQLHRVLEAMRTRDPATRVWTWFEPDQSVGFWVRRMMQETVIHRADVESASRLPARVDNDVALDGIDELVERMLCYWTDDYVEAPGSGERVVIESGGSAWTVTLGSDAATFERRALAGADARVTGEPSDVLLALWNRLPYDAVTTSGDASALDALRVAVVAATQ